MRFKVICALNKLHRAPPEIVLDFQTLETVLATEIMGQDRTDQMIEAISGPGRADDTVIRALKDSVQQELKRIFRLLGRLSPELICTRFTGGVTSKERARLADRLGRTRLGNREQAVSELVSSEDPWLRSRA